jgi:hypothetical protein
MIYKPTKELLFTKILPYLNLFEDINILELLRRIHFLKKKVPNIFQMEISIQEVSLMISKKIYVHIIFGTIKISILDLFKRIKKMVKDF